MIHPTPAKDVFDALVGEYHPVVYGSQTERRPHHLVDVLLSPAEQLSLKNRHPRSLERLPSTSHPRLVRNEMQPSVRSSPATSPDESPESPSAQWERPQDSYDEGSLCIKSNDTSLDRLIKELEELESFSCDGHSIPCLCSEDDNRRASDPDVATDFEKRLFDWIDSETKQQPALPSCTALQVAVSHLESPRRASIHSIESARSAGLDSPCSDVITEGYRADAEGSPAKQHHKEQTQKSQYRRGSRIYVRHILHPTVVRVRRGSVKIEGVNSTLRRPSILSPAFVEERQNRKRSVTFVEPQKKHVNVEQWGDPFAGSKAFGKQRELLSPRVGVRPRAMTSPQVIDAGLSWRHAGPSRSAFYDPIKLSPPAAQEEGEVAARPAMNPLEPIPLPRRVSRTRTKSCSQGLEIAPAEIGVELLLERGEDPPQGGFPLPIGGPLRGLNAPDTAEIGGSGFVQQRCFDDDDDYLPAEKRHSLTAWTEGTLAASRQSALISPSIGEVLGSPSTSMVQVQSEWIPLLLDSHVHPSSPAASDPFIFDRYMRRIPSDAITTTSTLITDDVAKARRAFHRQVRAIRRQLVSPTATRPIRISSIPMSHLTASSRPSPIARQFSCPSHQLGCSIRNEDLFQSPSPSAWLASPRPTVLSSRTCSAPGLLDAAMINSVRSDRDSLLRAEVLRPKDRGGQSISPGSHRTTDLPCSPAWRSTPSSTGLPAHVLGHSTVDLPIMGLGLSMSQPVFQSHAAFANEESIALEL